MRTRSLAALTCVVGLLAACGGGGGQSSSQTGGSVTITQIGGTLGAALKVAYFDPFEKATGIKVKAVPAEPTLGEVTTQVQKHSVLWDLAQMSGQDAIAGCSSGLFEKVDFSNIDKSKVMSGGTDDCGVTAITYVQGIAWNTTTLKITPTWQDFFDLQKYPGKRAYEKYIEDGGLEDAELGAGISKDQLYPIKFDVAFTQLRKLGSNVVFVDSLAQASQLLTSGNVVMIQTAVGRILPLQKAGLPIGFNPIGLRGNDFWQIPKGAKNKAQAEQFLSFIASCESCSAELARITAYAGPNAKGDLSVDKQTAALMASSPTVLASSYAPDLTYWGRNSSDIEKRWAAFLVSG